MNAHHPAALIISSDDAAANELKTALTDHRIEQVPDVAAVPSLRLTHRFEFVFWDIRSADHPASSEHLKAALDTQLAQLRDFYPATPIIAMAPADQTRQAVMAVKAGADNYLTLPLSTEELRYAIDTIYQEKVRQSEIDYLRGRFWRGDALDMVKTRSKAMQRVFEKIRSVAPTKTTVILYGETGTGKSMIAGLIHSHSNRGNNQFISVHCGAIPDTLLESELFGHEKGAFTGAIRRKMGKFEIAQRGTVFLDEIGTISAAAQVKLLKVLQDRTFQRVGGDTTLTSDARVLTATNADLKKMTETGQFRKDLFYRLNVFPIEIPSLTQRREDIPLLVEHFLGKLNKYYQKNINGIEPLVLDAMARYPWPGNIRELENLVERSYILENSSVLTPDSFPGELFGDPGPRAQLQLNTGQPLAVVRRMAIDNVERQYLIEVLSRNLGRINRSATDAGITARQLHKLMTKHRLRKETFRPPTTRNGTQSSEVNQSEL